MVKQKTYTQNSSEQHHFKTIILYGIRRSGNHFLISSILQQFTNYVHINNLNEGLFSYENYKKYKKRIKTKKRVDKYWIGFKNTDCLIISIESKVIDYDELKKFENVAEFYKIILLRGPYDNFSSIYEFYDKDIEKLKFSIKLWKIYAEIFKSNDDDEHQDHHQFIKVLYDELCTNNIYIYNLLNRLNIRNIKQVDKEKKIKWQYSSFDDKQSRRIYSSLENCIFSNDKQFVDIIKESTFIESLWYQIKK